MRLPVASVSGPWLRPRKWCSCLRVCWSNRQAWIGHPADRQTDQQSGQVPVAEFTYQARGIRESVGHNGWGVPVVWRKGNSRRGEQTNKGCVRVSSPARTEQEKAYQMHCVTRLYLKKWTPSRPTFSPFDDRTKPVRFHAGQYSSTRPPMYSRLGDVFFFFFFGFGLREVRALPPRCHRFDARHGIPPS